MTILALWLLAQPFNFENKQVFYPEPIRAESTHSYNVLHYFIVLDLPMDSRYLEGAVTISARSNEDNLTMVDLHLLGLGVDSVRVDGVTATYNHNDETLYVNLPQPYNQGDSFDIMVGYSGTGSGNMGYLRYTAYGTVTYTLGCPFSTRRWMPCYDRLWDKADNGVECYITVPDSFMVCATGEYLGCVVSGGEATYHWKHGYPISPYLIHFASSKFMTYSDWYFPVPSESIEIRYFFWPQDSSYAYTAFSLCTDMMYFYDSLFGDYPFECYGTDVVYPFYYLGMEHQTMATITRTWIRPTPDYYGIAHEMSHMWWGDMVTCFGWENVWLNEGFATYLDALYRERREGHAAFVNTMVSRRDYYFSVEQSNPHSIYDPPESNIFETSHAYYKGSWVLHMIRYLCGDDETWLNLMAAYRDSFEYMNASTDDLNRIMNQELNGDYDWFFDEWVYALYFPIYDVLWNKVYEAPNWRLVIDLTQTQPVGPAVFHMPLPIGVDYASGDTIITLAINDSPQHFEFLLPQEPMDIIVDPETWILQKNTVTGVFEDVAHKRVSINRLRTVGRAIEVNLSAPMFVKIFDITGRKVHESYTKELFYRPSSSGVYHVVIGDLKQRVVIIK